MKKYLLIFLFIAPVVVFTACHKTLNKVADYTISDASISYLKVVHASPSFRTLFNAQDTFNVYVNDARMNSPVFTFNSIYPSAGVNTYMAVQPGLQTIKFSIPGVVNPDSVKIYSLQKNFEAGKSYTLFITDSIKSARDSSKLFVKDSFNTPAIGYVNIRFVNAVVNDTVGKTVDLFSYARNATVFTKIKPDSATIFQSLGFNTGVADTFYVRRTGTNVVMAKLLMGAANQRTYTIVYKGDGTLTTGTKAPSIAVYVH